jgi:glycosyltransferase involved in cell wall biosynthesis
MPNSNEIVTVVVPAYNAEHTIIETLTSIARQSYEALAILVVDDGSTDSTATLVEEFAKHDPRFQLLRKLNGGVASARNEGIRASKSEFIAFIDADDLWHPTKIAKQMAVMSRGGPDLALVYTSFRLIDAEGMVLMSPRKFGIHGWVLHRHLHTNFIGNGSSILVRKSVLMELGGYDPSLRDADAEGCEDMLLQMRVAAHYRFGEVPEYLVGYRRLPGNMSSNTEQMIRSGILAVRTALAECHDVPHLSGKAILKRYQWQRLTLAARSWRIGACLRLMLQHPTFVPIVLWKGIAAVATSVKRSILRAALLRDRPTSPPQTSLKHYDDFDPADGIDLASPPRMSRVFRRLTKLDDAYRPRNTPSASPLKTISLNTASPNGTSQYSAALPITFDKPAA